MANEKNLVSLKNRTTTERREIAKKGGIASGAARREKKTMRELIEAFGEAKTKLDDIEMTNDEAVIYAQYRKAQDAKAMGSTEAAKFIRDTKGEAPVKNELTLNANIESITINFGKGKNEN